MFHALIMVRYFVIFMSAILVGACSESVTSHDGAVKDATGDSPLQDVATKDVADAAKDGARNDVGDKDVPTHDSDLVDSGSDTQADAASDSGQCTLPSECPPPPWACQSVSCVAGSCKINSKKCDCIKDSDCGPQDVYCPSSCGAGKCIIPSCPAPPKCPDVACSPNACTTVQCVSNACEHTLKEPGSLCNGGTCDKLGNCLP